MLYSPNNAAKQWILEELSSRSLNSASKILDLGCGSAWIWDSFLVQHPHAFVVGVDFDAEAIEQGKKHYQQSTRIELRIGDAQKPVEAGAYDAVVAFSAIEHVVNRKAFLETAYQSLKPGGIAYLNYDVGHFRSTNFKERIMVPLSQVLAIFGSERSYMKRVDDKLFRKQAEEVGFTFINLRKHNVASLKGLFRGTSTELIEMWYDFEEQLGVLMRLESLDAAMLSTTIVLQKT